MANDTTPAVDRVITDYQRGCGTLKKGSGYLRSSPENFSKDGVLPIFVKCDPPIPWKGTQFRSPTRFPGMQFECVSEEPTSTPDDVERWRWTPLHRADDGSLVDASEDLVENFRSKSEWFQKYDDSVPWPTNEIERHFIRLRRTGRDGEVADAMPSAKAPDLIMNVGKNHYPDPEGYIRECVTLGLNKRISISSGENGAPSINPGRTRLFLTHGNAIEREEKDNLTGIIGYAYLTDVIYTMDEDGKPPDHIRKKAGSGDVDIVDIGEEVPYSHPSHPLHSREAKGRDLDEFEEREE